MNQKYRIIRATDFRRVRQTGKSTAHPLVALVTAEGIEDHPRAGIVTSKSVGKAVQRNRARRQLRVVLAQLLPQINKPVDMLLIARSPISGAKFNEIRLAVIDVLMRAKLLENHDNNNL